MDEDPEGTGAAVTDLATALAQQEEGLLTCVHCGFCLPACPTYVRLGDENDSPRGRLHLMRAVVEERLDPSADAFQLHIDRCLGCRACEPVCPSGVPYGELLELARAEAGGARPRSLVTRLFLWVFASSARTAAFLAVGRILRASGVAALLAGLLPRSGWLGRFRLAFGMLAATRAPELRSRGGAGGAAVDGGLEATDPSPRGADGTKGPKVVLLRGCVQEGLFARVNRATERVLRQNGKRVVRVSEQGCCGALHAHAGELGEARRLARRNIDAFESVGADFVVVNSAGCGATMKGYGHLLAGDPAYGERAARLADRVLDISEALVGERLRKGAPIPLTVAYDPPCHLLHGQGVEGAPLEMLAAVPGLEVVRAEDAGECCGGAGIYGLTHPGLGGEIGRDKVDRICEAGVDLVATGNPGCIMQIGALLRDRGTRLPVVHPVELLDESYRRAGLGIPR